MTYWAFPDRDDVWTVVRNVGNGYEGYNRRTGEWAWAPLWESASGIGGNGHFEEISEAEAGRLIAEWETAAS